MSAPPRPPLDLPVGARLEPLRRTVRARLERLPAPIAEFLLFGLKQAWACLFAGLMLGLLLVTHWVWNPAWPIHRYDALFAAAVTIQVIFLVFELETWDEARVIAVYHVVGTAMELFKTDMGSWVYPEPALIRLGGVPLFTGFMYAAVGSYMARVIRIFDMRFSNYPPRVWVLLLAAAIYLNFFTHHWLPDARIVLFAASALLFGRVRIWFTVDRVPRWMPFLMAALLTALFMWVAENIGTWTGTWLYPGQRVWHWVSWSKMGSWYLLLIISFALLTLVTPPRPPDAPATEDPAPNAIRPTDEDPAA